MVRSTGTRVAVCNSNAWYTELMSICLPILATYSTLRLRAYGLITNPLCKVCDRGIKEFIGLLYSVHYKNIVLAKCKGQGNCPLYHELSWGTSLGGSNLGGTLFSRPFEPHSTIAKLISTEGSPLTRLVVRAVGVFRLGKLSLLSSYVGMDSRF